VRTGSSRERRQNSPQPGQLGTYLATYLPRGKKIDPHPGDTRHRTPGVPSDGDGREWGRI